MPRINEITIQWEANKCLTRRKIRNNGRLLEVATRHSGTGLRGGFIFRRRLFVARFGKGSQSAGFWWLVKYNYILAGFALLVKLTLIDLYWTPNRITVWERLDSSVNLRVPTNFNQSVSAPYSTVCRQFKQDGRLIKYECMGVFGRL